MRQTARRGAIGPSETARALRGCARACVCMWCARVRVRVCVVCAGLSPCYYQRRLRHAAASCHHAITYSPATYHAPPARHCRRRRQLPACSFAAACPIFCRLSPTSIRWSLFATFLSWFCRRQDAAHFDAIDDCRRHDFDMAPFAAIRHMKPFTPSPRAEATSHFFICRSFAAATRCAALSLPRHY